MSSGHNLIFCLPKLNGSGRSQRRTRGGQATQTQSYVRQVPRVLFVGGRTNTGTAGANLLSASHFAASAQPVLNLLGHVNLRYSPLSFWGRAHVHACRDISVLMLLVPFASRAEQRIALLIGRHCGGWARAAKDHTAALPK